MIRDKKQIVKIVAWILVLLWMLLIFNLSSQVAEESNKLSKGVTEVVVQTVEKVVPQKQLDPNTFNHIVRKNAHFFAYLLLGILVINAFRRSGYRERKFFLLALVICFLYAVSDEVHQLFVPGRGGQVKDVLLDSIGAAVGVVLYGLLKKIIDRRRSKSHF